MKGEEAGRADVFPVLAAAGKTGKFNLKCCWKTAVRSADMEADEAAGVAGAGATSVCQTQISREFRNLAVAYQEVIANASCEIAAGMVEYLQKQVESVQDWEKYCDHVSASITRGMSVIFSLSGLEDPIVGEDKRLSSSFGLFMQKSNIIRDFLDDQLNGQEFWPEEVWSKYGKNLSDFTKPENIVPAVQCLNELITNALQHMPDILLYLSRLRNQNVFKFCAAQLIYRKIPPTDPSS